MYANDHNTLKAWMTHIEHVRARDPVKAAEWRRVDEEARRRAEADVRLRLQHGLVPAMTETQQYEAALAAAYAISDGASQQIAQTEAAEAAAAVERARKLFRLSFTTPPGERAAPLAYVISQSEAPLGRPRTLPQFVPGPPLVSPRSMLASAGGRERSASPMSPSGRALVNEGTQTPSPERSSSPRHVHRHRSPTHHHHNEHHHRDHHHRHHHRHHTHDRESPRHHHGSESPRRRSERREEGEAPAIPRSSSPAILVMGESLAASSPSRGSSRREDLRASADDAVRAAHARARPAAAGSASVDVTSLLHRASQVKKPGDAGQRSSIAAP